MTLSGNLRTAFTLACGALLLAACSSKWHLMPTPLVHQYLGAEAFQDHTPQELSQDVELLYATNRPGTGAAGAREYGNGIVDKLQLGIAKVRLGEPGLGLRDMIELSTSGKRKTEVPLTLEGTRELDVLPDTSGRAFAAAVNRQLARCKTSDVTIYVHGAKSTFVRSAVQGAQFYHFMTRDTAFISFAWPSTGKFISYDKDVEFAAQTAPALAKLIEYLADNTRAQKINILSYSAGGQVVAPGLARLRTAHPNRPAASLKRRYRLGDVYLAAADVGMHKFINEYLPAYTDIVDNTTLTFQREDFVLKFAELSHEGETRLGRPDGGQLSEQEVRGLERLAHKGTLDILDMGYATGERPVDFKAHGNWYLNPWVSSDAILQFLFHPEPSRRGLLRKPDSQVWYFPHDYPERLRKIVAAGNRQGS